MITTTRRGRRLRPLVVALGLVLAASSCNGSTPSARRGATPPARLAADAYVWGVPLVVSARTRATFARLVGVNRLAGQSRRSDPSARVIPAPNVDTLYSVAVLDLRAGPLALTVPAVTDRYFTYQFLDAWTEAFAYVGTRATGGRAGTWVITPPGWSGNLPPGTQRISAPTPELFLLGRFLVRDDADIANVAAIRRRVRLGPLSPGTVTPLAPPAPPVGAPQAVAGAGAAFFDELGDALAQDPPTSAADRASLRRFAALGIGPGRHPATNAAPGIRAALARGVTDGEARIASATARDSRAANGWSLDLHVGRYGTDSLLRAVVARHFWGANVPEEAVYPVAATDADGRPFTGTGRYVLHFDANNLPPVRAFWSLTLYGPDGFLVPNAQHRYAIGDRTTSLRANPDGSLDLAVQHDPPPGHEGNWLPAPTGAFTLMLRMYLPEPSVLDGTYRLPPVRRVG